MDDRPTEQSRRWRPRLRLSVRVLMLLVLALGGGLGWVVHRARVQREAVAEIMRAKGNVDYDGTFLVDSSANAAHKPGWREWLVDRLGIDYFETAVTVYLYGPRGFTDQADGPPSGRVVNDATMAEVGKLQGLIALDLDVENHVTAAGLDHLRGLIRLQKLNLRRVKVQGPALANLGEMTRLTELSLWTEPSDTDLAHLAGLTALRYLSISGRRITDPGLAHLGALRNLEILFIMNSPITSAGLSHLGGLSQLTTLYLGQTRVDSLDSLKHLTKIQYLSLDGTPIDDTGLAPVAGLRTLCQLDLSGTRISDPGLAHLAGLPALVHLELTGTRVTDAGLIRLAGLPKLRYLKLNETRITDAGLRQFTALNQTTELNVSGTGVTEEGIAALKRLNPGLKIDH